MPWHPCLFYRWIPDVPMKCCSRYHHKVSLTLPCVITDQSPVDNGFALGKVTIKLLMTWLAADMPRLAVRGISFTTEEHGRISGNLLLYKTLLQFMVLEKLLIWGFIASYTPVLYEFPLSSFFCWKIILAGPSFARQVAAGLFVERKSKCAVAMFLHKRND